MIERAPEFSRMITFKQLRFESATVNGMRVRDADYVVSMLAFGYLMGEIPELRAEDYNYFDFQVDWLTREVVVTEREIENQW